MGLGEVELIKGSSALKYGAEAIGGLLFFNDLPFISSEELKFLVESLSPPAQEMLLLQGLRVPVGKLRSH